MKCKFACSPPWGMTILAPLLLAGCQGGILDPKGQIAADEKSLIITATTLMLLVVIPVIVLTLVFAWKYRAGNTHSPYTPKWAHSNKIEAIVWSVPIIIVICLAVVAWRTTHQLDPYRPLDSAVPPVQVQVIAMDWKWLFIYPELGIASVNELAFPKNTPVDFRITSDSVMNAFFIPQLGGQIYAMAGMETQLHLIANEAGTYHGMSSNYSGAGFSGMKFSALATETPEAFQEWVQKVRTQGTPLDVPAYRELVTPSENSPVIYYTLPRPLLFDAVLRKYMAGRGNLADDYSSRIDVLTKQLCDVPLLPLMTPKE